MRVPSYSGNIIRIALQIDNASSSTFKSLLGNSAPPGCVVADPRPLLFTRLPASQRQSCEEFLSRVASVQTPFPLRLFKSFIIIKPAYGWVGLRVTSPQLENVRAKLIAQLGTETMKAERKSLGLKEVRSNWGLSPMVFALSNLEKEDATRIKNELQMIFPEESTDSSITLNAIGFSLRETRIHEKNVPHEDLPDKEFPFLG
jgi:hypothetical protein